MSVATGIRLIGEKRVSRRVVHLTGSPFFGGPERQMLGMAQHLPLSYQTLFLSFSEGGRARAFLDRVTGEGFEAVELEKNAPHFRQAVGEVAAHLRRVEADVLCCSGYKADVIGWLAARRERIPVVSIAHGWTAATLKVRLNETLDRLVMRWMDCTVCVSEGQAAKVRRAGVPAERVEVIRNAIQTEPFDRPDPGGRLRLQALFPRPRRRIVGAAGRLSQEKGFDQLVEAAALVRKTDSEVGFVLFGEGPLRERLAQQIAARGLENHFILAGFRTDLERWLPHVDLVALPSFTEGLPVVVLEAGAAGVPVVATAVGGTPEAIENGVTGYLVPPRNPAALARRILDALRSEPGRRTMGQRARQRVEAHFTFAAQSVRYQRLIERLLRKRKSFRFHFSI